MAGAAFNQVRRSKRGYEKRSDCDPVSAALNATERTRGNRGGGMRTARSISVTEPRGVEDPDFDLKSQHEKLLDDTEVLLYCDRQFDRQFLISLS
jgi:hypothetical protein